MGETFEVPWSHLAQGWMGHWTLAVPKVRVSITYLSTSSFPGSVGLACKADPRLPPPFLSF